MTESDRTLIADLLNGEHIPAAGRAWILVTGWIDEVVRAHVWDSSIDPGDVRSDTRFKLLQNLRDARFQGRSTLKTYVQRIARLTIIDLARARQRARELARALDPPGEETPEDLLLNEEKTYLLQRVFHLIGDKCRELWEMAFSHGLCYREIAEAAGVKEGTIKARMFHCKEEAIRIMKQLQ